MVAEDAKLIEVEQAVPDKQRDVSEGVRRLSMVAGLVPVIVCSLVAIMFSFNGNWAQAVKFFIGGLVLASLFWGAVRAVAWIIEGFRRGRSR